MFYLFNFHKPAPIPNTFELFNKKCRRIKKDSRAAFGKSRGKKNQRKK